MAAEAIATEALGLFRVLGDTGERADVHFMLGSFGINSGDYQRRGNAGWSETAWRG